MKLARLAPLVLVALVGCSPSPTTAAQVGDTTITQQRVQDLVASCPAVQDSEITEPVALTMLVRTELLRVVGANHDIEITDDTMRGLLKQDEATGPFLAEAPGCIDLLLPQAGSLLLSEAVSGEEVVDELGDIDVQLNPRYGQWESDQAVVAGSGSLSVPVTEG